MILLKSPFVLSSTPMILHFGQGYVIFWFRAGVGNNFLPGSTSKICEVAPGSTRRGGAANGRGGARMLQGSPPTDHDCFGGGKAPLPTKHPCCWQSEETSHAPPPRDQSGPGGAREASSCPSKCCMLLAGRG